MDDDLEFRWDILFMWFILSMFAWMFVLTPIYSLWLFIRSLNT